MRFAIAAICSALVIGACAAAPQPSPTATLTLSPTTSPSPSAAPTASAAPTTSAAPTATVAPSGTLEPSPTPTQPATPDPTPTATTAPASWLESTDIPTYGLRTHVGAITYAEDTFVAVGWSFRNDRTRGRVWTSTDGLSWAAQPDSQFVGRSMNAVTHDGADFYAFASAPTTVWRSPDGQAWEQVELPQSGGELGTSDAFTGAYVADATSHDGILYAAGETTIIDGDIACDCAALWSSPDGTEWTPSTVSPPNYFTSFAVAGTAPYAVAIGSNSYIGDAIMYSANLESWTEQDLGLGEDYGFVDIAGDGTRLVGVGWRNEFSEPISLVTDGNSWVVHPIQPGVDAIAEQVSWAAGQFTAVGTRRVAGRLVAVSWVSADGVEWTPGPKVYDRTPDDPGTEPGDDPINYRAIGAGLPGVVVAQTFADGLHVWFAPPAMFEVAPGGV